MDNVIDMKGKKSRGRTVERAIADAETDAQAADKAFQDAMVAPVELPPPLPIIVVAPIADIDESPTNPRQTYRALDELAADIKVNGVLQPGLARPSPVTDGRFELVFASRRFRASKLAGMTTFPLMIRTLTDEQVLEIQLAENNNRDDVHPLEEADGFQRGIRAHGWTVEELAAKVGKGVGLIRQRLKYCSLIPAAREAFLADRLTAATALIVARIPNPETQAKALKEILEYGSGGVGEDEVPTSKADASWIVKSKYMLRLVDAPFDRKDAHLIAVAGACGDCPKRTGNQRGLFDDVDAKDDMCTDVECFALKRDAGWAKTVATAEARGRTILSESETKKAFPHGSMISYDAEYIDLSEENYEPGKGNGKTFRSLLPKGSDVPIVIARDKDGRVHELVAKSVYAKAAPDAGVKAPPKQKAAEKKPASHAARMRLEKEDHEKALAARRELVAELGARAEKSQPTDAFWRVLATTIVRDAHLTGLLDGELKKLIPAIRKMKGGALRRLIVETMTDSDEASRESVKELCEHFKIKPSKAALGSYFGA